MTDTYPTANPLQAVIVRNLGDELIAPLYAGVRYPLIPAKNGGKPMPVPWEAAVLWFGDPTLKDRGDEPELKYRTKEANRINQRFGMLDAPFYSVNVTDWTVDTNAGDTNVVDRPYVPLAELKERYGYEPAGPIAETYQSRHPSLPLIEVTAAGTNERVIMVIDDPHGEADMLVGAMGHVQVAADTELRDIIAGQQRQLDQLTALLAQKDPAGFVEMAEQKAAVPHGVSDFTVPADEPEINNDPLDPDTAALFDANTDADPLPPELDPLQVIPDPVVPPPATTPKPTPAPRPARRK